MINLNIDYADYKCVNSHNGYAVGINSDKIKFDKLEKEIIDKFKQHIKVAKAISIVFHINQNQNIEPIAEFMNIVNTISSNCNIIFGTSLNNDIDCNEVKLDLLITGLETV